MLLYISGFNSTPKPWIPVTLKEQLDQNEVVYYVLKNVLSEDLKNLREIMQANEDYFKSPSPVCLYQGMLDDRVDIPYNEKMMLALAGHVYRYPDLGHKFDQSGFRMTLRDVRASC